MTEQIKHKYGVLLVNSGTIEELSERGVRTYLKRILSDKRVVNLPRILWMPILYFSILRKRPKQILWQYEMVWDHGVSFYDRICKEQREGVSMVLAEMGYADTKVIYASRYSRPQIKDAMRYFKKLGIKDVVVLPLYPQSAYSTTSSIFDETMRSAQLHHRKANIRFIKNYHKNPGYISALTASIKERYSSGKLVFSFHSIPNKDIENGDTYELQTSITVDLIASELGIDRKDWTISYQSKFPDSRKWLPPFLTHTIDCLIESGRNEVTVICPGFATDCIETLIEVGYTTKGKFIEGVQNKGNQDVPNFTYIPALNARKDHIKALAQIIAAYL